MLTRKNLCWLPLAVIALLFFFTQTYPDFVGMARLSFDLLDHLFHGQFLTYYHSMEWLYGIWVYLLYAIWELPVYLAFQLLHIPSGELEQVVPALLWIKLLPFGAGLFSLVTFRSLADQVLKAARDKEIALYLYAASLFVILPVLGTATNDIVYLPFIQLGIGFYLKGKNRPFLLCFALANSGKLLSLFIFLPLLFYRDKKPLVLLRNMAASLALIVIDKLLLLPSASAGIGRGKTGEFFQYLLRMRLEVGPGINVLPMAFALLCLYAFLRGGFRSEQRAHEAIWLSGLGITLFFLFGMHHSQWCILMATFLPLICMLSGRLRALQIFLLTAFEGLFVFRECFMLTWVFAGWGAYEYLILKHFGRQSIRGQNAVTWFFDYVLGSAAPYAHMDLIYTILLFLAVCLFVLGFPGRAKEGSAAEGESGMAPAGIRAALREGILPLLVLRTLLPAFYWIYTFIVLIWL